MTDKFFREMGLTARMWTSVAHVAITALWSTARASISRATTRAAVRADTEWTPPTPRVFLSTSASPRSTRVTVTPRASQPDQGHSRVLVTSSSLGMDISVNVSFLNCHHFFKKPNNIFCDFSIFSEYCQWFNSRMSKGHQFIVYLYVSM